MGKIRSYILLFLTRHPPPPALDKDCIYVSVNCKPDHLLPGQTLGNVFEWANMTLLRHKENVKPLTMRQKYHATTPTRDKIYKFGEKTKKLRKNYGKQETGEKRHLSVYKQDMFLHRFYRAQKTKNFLVTKSSW